MGHDSVRKSKTDAHKHNRWRRCKHCKRRKKYPPSRLKEDDFVYCSNTCKYADPAYREKMGKSMSKAQQGKKHSLARRRHVSEAMRKVWANRPKAEKERLIQHFIKSAGELRRPNKLEIYFQKAIGRRVKYTGNGEKFFKCQVIRRRNPDFMVPGKKKVIEILGDYWHGLKHCRSKKDRQAYVRQIQRDYASVGYECLCLWERDIRRNITVVKKRVAYFLEG